MNKTKGTQLIVRINSDLHEWFKVYTQRINTTMSALVTESIESLRRLKAVPPDTSYQHTTYQQELERAEHKLQHSIELAEEKSRQVQQLWEQLAEKDNQLSRRDEQIDHLTQVVAMSQKNIAQLTEQLDNSRQMIEDKRKPLWRRLFRR